MWVAIFTGAGERAFSAGNDLKFQAQGGVARMPPTRLRRHHVARATCGSRVIAAVNGVALGGGLELALACDIIVAADHARLGLPEPRVGLMAAAGGVHRLPRHIPLKVAMGMMLTGRHVTAAEALRVGLVNEVVPAAELMPTAERWAKEILECSPLSVQATKQAALEGLGKPLLRGARRRLSAGADALPQRGLHRGAAGVRGEAEAELEGDAELARPLAPRCR